MNWKVRTTLIAAAVALAATVTVAQAAADPAGAAGSSQLKFKLDEYKISPDAAEAKAGTVRIKAKNIGGGEHELVVARTKRKPGDLPMGRDGVKEGAINVIGEIAELPPGEAGKVELELKSGKYVMFCNVPGHYAQGMYGRIKVK